MQKEYIIVEKVKEFSHALEDCVGLSYVQMFTLKKVKVKIILGSKFVSPNCQETDKSQKKYKNLLAVKFNYSKQHILLSYIIRKIL